MTDPSRGITVGVRDASRSRRAVTVTTGVVGLTEVTLMPGVLGTEDGAEILARASDLRTLNYVEPRRSARDSRRGE